MIQYIIYISYIIYNVFYHIYIIYIIYHIYFNAYIVKYIELLMQIPYEYPGSLYDDDVESDKSRYPSKIMNSVFSCTIKLKDIKTWL